jgi:hypothetical protein
LPAAASVCVHGPAATNRPTMAARTTVMLLRIITPWHTSTDRVARGIGILKDRASAGLPVGLPFRLPVPHCSDATQSVPSSCSSLLEPDLGLPTRPRSPWLSPSEGILRHTEAGRKAWGPSRTARVASRPWRESRALSQVGRNRTVPGPLCRSCVAVVQATEVSPVVPTHSSASSMPDEPRP